MKKITLLAFMLFASAMYSQVPSIKQAKRKVSAPSATTEEIRALLEDEQSARTESELLVELKQRFKDNPAVMEELEKAEKAKAETNSAREMEFMASDFRWLNIKQAELEGMMDKLKVAENDLYAKMRRDGTNATDEKKLADIKSAISELSIKIDENSKNLKASHPQGFLPTVTGIKEKTGKGNNAGKTEKSIKQRRDEFFNMLYSKDDDKDFYFVNNAALQINDEANSVQSELTSAYLGGFRLSLGTVLSNSGDEGGDQEEPGTPEAPAEDDSQAFQRLISGGGNVYLNVELPLYFRQAGPFVAYLNGYGKGAADFEKISNDIDTSTANGSVGFNFYTSLSTDENEFNFFANVSYAGYFGGNQFYDALKIADRDPFGFGQLTVGMTVYNKVRFSFTTNTWGSEENLRSGTVIFGIQVLSGLFEQ